jgi:diadenosine tetraphosphate (Ap4A) HIT family hydrolase
MFLQKPEEVLIGSGVIVPKEHRETVFDLSKDEWNATFELLQEVKLFIDKKYRPQGYNVGWNVGSVGGQEIFHVHLHVIPRYEDETLAGKGIRYWLKQPQNKRNIIL